ncbi:hypothetical protein KSP39_PZI010061 [Platanthera zijinensis]|uniref:Uncharacterized protein n=1 Tax=Platanthera zijinensis TaxID=2320716 RepID=A0AAP0BIF2_9ASPA
MCRCVCVWVCDCVCDGTHVDTCIAVGQQVPYIGRRGNPTQNVMAACDFNMCFTFIIAGLEGSQGRQETTLTLQVE